jgi:hypothetical protein
VGEDHTGEPGANQDRLTVAQAATRLGITEGAVRSRIKRGTLPTAKEGGTVFVLLGDGTSQANQTPNTGVPGDQSELIEALRDQIGDLRRERDEWREQARITDRLLSAAMERIPAIEPPQEPSESPETVEEASERAGPHSEAAEAREELDAERTLREMAEATLHEGMAEERRRREAAERERDALRRQLNARGRQQGAHEAAEEQQGRGQPQFAAGGAQEPSEPLRGRGSGTVRGSWWRRLFGR